MTTGAKDWDRLLESEFQKDYIKELEEFLSEEYENHKIHPDRNDVFTALRWTGYEDTKVVIFGQDPYHGENQAHGLAFSVKRGVEIPPSLLNMYKELKNELGLYIPDNGFLEKWARQGVLLLNSALTVRDGEANSHKGKGWERLTDRITELLNERKRTVIFLLWGNDARRKEELITAPQHIVLTAAHPSPLSANRGFFGCGHFAKVNNMLEAMNKAPIDWQIENGAL